MDAWDDGDDDLMIDMANIKMSMKDIQSTAKAVIDHDRQTRNANIHYNGIYNLLYGLFPKES